MKATAVNRSLKLAAFAALILPSMVAYADEGDWYVAPSIAYFDDDGDRLLDDSVAGGQIQFGKEMSDRFWLEGLLGYHDIDGFPGQEHLEVGVNAVGNFLPDSRFSPYAIGGLGYLRADVGTPSFGGLPPADTTANNLTATAGLGLKIRFGDSPWSLRTEWRLRYAFDSDDSLTDQIASVGIQYSFGGSDAPAVVSEPEPVAEQDSDGDGVVDSLDTCLSTPQGVKVDSSGCPLDSDGDGVADDRDRCPGTAAGVEVDADGCEVVIELKPVYFETESAVLDAEAQSALDESAATLKRYPNVQVEIGGHADSRGTDAYNMALSLRRADSVRKYLEQAGVNAAQLTVEGYGESRPVATNETRAGQAANRRVEIEVLER